MRKTLIFSFILFFSINSSIAQVPVDATWGKGLRLQAIDSSFSMKFSFRFQTLYSGSYQTENEEWRESLMIRRSRLKFDGYAFRPNIIYKVEFGLSNRDKTSGRLDESGNTGNIILDAVAKWGFAPGWELWFGQTKLPGNRERVISSQKLQFVDRSLVNSRFNLDRDIGLQLRRKHRFGKAVLKEAVAISTGEGRDIIISNPDNGHQYTFRLEMLPFGEFASGGDYFGSDLAQEETGKLSLGISYDFNQRTPRSRGNLGSFITDEISGKYQYSDLSTLFVDAIFKYHGLSVTSEYVHRSAAQKTDGFGYGEGITAAAGYLFKSNYEIAGRYTTIEPISAFSSITPTTEYMIGVSKYVSGHSLKIQSDLSYTQVEGRSDFLMFRLQCEVAL